MHRTFDYNVIADETKRKAKAISDIKDWIGPKKFVQITRDVKRCQPPMTGFQFAMMCELGGIQGYPVRVWAEQVGLTLPEAEEQVAA